MKWKIKDFLYRHWAAIIPVLLLFVAAWYLSHHHREIDTLRAENEAAQARLKGQIVAVQEDNRKLVGSLGVMVEKNRLLAEAVAEAKAAAPDSTMAGVATLQTTPVRVQRAPRADPPNPPGPPLPPCASNHYAPDGTGTFYCVEDPAKGKDPDDKKPVCVLASDDSVSISVDQVILKTGEGNTLIAGAASVWREAPPPRAKLAEGKFSAALSQAETVKAPSLPRWGAEGGAYCLSRSGCGPEVGVLLPPWRFLGITWEPRGTAYGGADWGVGAALGARF